MNYYRYNENLESIGVTEVEPEDSLWTEVPYLDAFLKPKLIDEVWIEGATENELIEYQKSLVPQEITKRQCKMALFILRGITPEAVEAFIETLPEPYRTIARFGWFDSNTFHRNNEMLIDFAPLFGMNTTTDLDELFIVGNTYN